MTITIWAPGYDSESRYDFMNSITQEMVTVRNNDLIILNSVISHILLHGWLQGLYSLLYSLIWMTSYPKILWSLKAVRFRYRLFQLLWNLTGTLAAVLLRCLWSFRSIQGSTLRHARMPWACRSCLRAHKLLWLRAQQGKWFSVWTCTYFPSSVHKLTGLVQILAGHVKIIAGHVNFQNHVSDGHVNQMLNVKPWDTIIKTPDLVTSRLHKILR